MVTNLDPEVEAVLLFNMHHVEYVFLNYLPIFFLNQEISKKTDFSVSLEKFQDLATKGTFSLSKNVLRIGSPGPQGPVCNPAGLGSGPWISAVSTIPPCPSTDESSSNTRRHGFYLCMTYELAQND